MPARGGYGDNVFIGMSCVLCCFGEPTVRTVFPLVICHCIFLIEHVPYRNSYKSVQKARQYKISWLFVPKNLMICTIAKKIVHVLAMDRYGAAINCYSQKTPLQGTYFILL